MADYNFLAAGVGPSLVEGSHAAYFGGKARQEADERQGTKDAAPFLADALKGDPNAITQLAQTAPHLLTHVYPMLARLDATKQAHMQKVADWAGDTAGAILDAPEPQRAGMYATAKTAAAAQGIPTDNWPQQYDPNWLAIQRAHAIGAKALFQSTHAKPKATGAGGGGGPDLEPMAGLTPAPGGTAMADAAPTVPPNALAQAAPAVAPAPVVAQAAPPPGPSGPPMVAKAAPPPNAGGLGAAEVGAGTGLAPDVPDMQRTQTQTPQIQAPMMPPAAALQAPAGAPEKPPAEPGKGVIWPTDPSLQGGVMMGHRAKPGQPLLPAEVGGHFIYRLPDGKTVLYKPTTQPVPNKFADEYGPDGKTLIGQRGPDNKFYPVNQKPAAPGIPPEMADVHGDEFLNYLQGAQPQKANIIRSILGQKPGFLPSDLSKRGDYNDLMGLVLQAQPDYDPTQGGQRRQFEMHNLINGDEAKTLSAANTAISHAKIFRDLTEAMQNGDTRLLNTIVNEAKKQFGDANVPSAEIARDLYGEELIKAVKGSGQLNEQQEQQMRKNLSINGGPKATQGVIDTLTNLMEGRVHTVEDTARRFGVPDSRIKEYITPRSREALDYIKSNPLGADKSIPTLSPEEAAKLPSGKSFRTTDGRVLVRP